MGQHYNLITVLNQTCEGGLVPEGAVHVDPGRLPHLDAHCPGLDLDLEGKEEHKDVGLAPSEPPCPALPDNWSRCDNQSSYTSLLLSLTAPSFTQMQPSLTVATQFKL